MIASPGVSKLIIAARCRSDSTAALAFLAGRGPKTLIAGATKCAVLAHLGSRVRERWADESNAAPWSPQLIWSDLLSIGMPERPA